MNNTARTIPTSGPETHEVNVYPDGSVKDKVWGECAWAIEDMKFGWFGRSYALGREGDVPTTELQGIRYALEYLVERMDAGCGLGTHITIHTDCMDALNMLICLFDTRVRDPLRDEVLRNIMRLLQKLRAQDVGVYFVWIGRCTMPGAQITDKAAGDGAVLSRRGRKGLTRRLGVDWVE